MKVIFACYFPELYEQIASMAEVQAVQVLDYSCFRSCIEESPYDLILLGPDLLLDATQLDNVRLGAGQLVPLARTLQARAKTVLLLEEEPSEPGLLQALNVAPCKPAEVPTMIRSLLENRPVRLSKLPYKCSEVVWTKDDEFLLEKGSAKPELRADLLSFLKTKETALAKLCGGESGHGFEWVGSHHEAVACTEAQGGLLGIAQSRVASVEFSTEEAEKLRSVFGVHP